MKYSLSEKKENKQAAFLTTAHEINQKQFENFKIYFKLTWYDPDVSDFLLKTIMHKYHQNEILCLSE